jgi:hypothetical protein
MKTIATLAAIGGALLVGSPAFSADEAQAFGHRHHNSHLTFKVQHHKHHTPHFRHYTPSYTYQQPTYYKPTYTYQPTYKNVEICFKWVKDGYGHATKVIIPCPVEHVAVKKPIIEKKVVNEQPVEQKPAEQQPVEQQPAEQQ